MMRTGSTHIHKLFKKYVPNGKQIGHHGPADNKIIESNIDKVAEVREKPKLIGWFVGQVMKESQGKANPAKVNDLVKKKIGI